MRPPKTPTDFDYDLWTTKDGRYMVRVKSTGEETEVDKETIRFLRAEEHRMRDGASRTNSEDYQEPISLAELSTDELPSEDVSTSRWLADPTDFTQDIITAAVEQEFLASLTLTQRKIYIEVIKKGITQKDYSKTYSICESVVSRHIQAIRKKAKNFFKKI